MNRSVYIAPEDSSILAVELGCLFLQLAANIRLDMERIGRTSGSTYCALPHGRATIT